jgi:hypothetical protein
MVILNILHSNIYVVVIVCGGGSPFLPINPYSGMIWDIYG